MYHMLCINLLDQTYYKFMFPNRRISSLSSLLIIRAQCGRTDIPQTAGDAEINPGF